MAYALPTSDKLLSDQTPLTLLACCVFGEARNQSRDAQIGVACVVRNRVRLNRSYMGGSTWAGVLLKPYQFDCFLPAGPNYRKLLKPLDFESPSVWEACYEAANAVYSLGVPDITKGAIFYYSNPVTAPPRAWGRVEFCVTLDGLHFYKPVTSEAQVALAA